MGKHDIGPEEIQDPADAWKARDFNEDHTATLMKSFQEHQKMNAKGLRLVLQHQAYWDLFEAMDEDQKNVAAELESDFYADLRAVQEFKPFTGDHSRRAAALLKQKYKQNPKWQMFRGVKVYLCAPGQESDDMLLQLGNINNTIQQIHRKLEFADKIKQMHTYFDRHGQLEVKASGRRSDKSGTVSAWLATTAASWGMQVASMGQLATLAKLQGETWANLLEILNGKYKVPGSKTFGGPPPNAISHFNMMGACSSPRVCSFFQGHHRGQDGPEEAARGLHALEGHAPPAALHLGGGNARQARQAHQGLGYVGQGFPCPLQPKVHRRLGDLDQGQAREDQ